MLYLHSDIFLTNIPGYDRLKLVKFIPPNEMLDVPVIVLLNIVVVNGQWGSWTEWGACTLSCGGGTRFRTRSCDSPSPSDNGRYCSGSDRQVDYCNRDDCPGRHAIVETASLVVYTCKFPT